MIEDQYSDEHPFDEWDDSWEEEDLEPLESPAWRKPLLIAVAAITAIAMGVIPIYNVLFDRSVADNGLEVCGFDYCVVTEAVAEAGLDLTMSELSHTFLTDGQARTLTDAATVYLGVAPVTVDVVDRLDGRLGGVYEPDTHSIRIERPARAWTVLHEVAHTVESGHGEDFQRVLIDLAEWVESGT